MSQATQKHLTSLGQELKIHCFIQRLSDWTLKWPHPSAGSGKRKPISVEEAAD